jgi:hypothetical protein
VAAVGQGLTELPLSITLLKVVWVAADAAADKELILSHIPVRTVPTVLAVVAAAARRWAISASRAVMAVAAASSSAIV